MNRDAAVRQLRLNGWADWATVFNKTQPVGPYMPLAEDDVLKIARLLDAIPEIHAFGTLAVLEATVALFVAKVHLFAGDYFL